MERLAFVESGIVVNIILGAAELAGTEGFENAVVCPEECAIGWLYDGETFTAPEVIPPEALPTTSFVSSGGLIRFSFGAPPSVLQNAGLGSITRIAKGRGRIYFSSARPNNQYNPLYGIQDAAIKYFRFTVKTAAYVEFRTWDQTNAAADVEEITVKIEDIVS